MKEIRRRVGIPQERVSACLASSFMFAMGLRKGERFLIMSVFL